MALVNWNPVTAANFSESNALRLAAQQQLAGGIKGFGDTATAFNDATGKANTDILLNSLVGQRTPEAAMAAIQAAKAQAGGMYNNYDQAAFRSAAEALPKSAADAQELDLQIADKPYLQAAALAYSKGDPEAVGHFVSQVRSNAGRAEVAKYVGDANALRAQNAGVDIAERTLGEKIRSSKVDEDQARYNGASQRIAAQNSGQPRQPRDGGLKAILKAAEDFKTTRDNNTVKGAISNGANDLKGQTDFNTTIANNSHPIWGRDAQSLHDLYMSNPAYKSAGWAVKNQALNAGLSYIKSEHPVTGYGGNDTLMLNHLNTTMGDIANTQKLVQENQISTDIARVNTMLDAFIVNHPNEKITPEIRSFFEAKVRGSNPIQDPVSVPPDKPTKETEQYLKDKAELAAREAKRQAALAAGKGSPKPVKGGVVLPSRFPIGINAPKDPTHAPSPTAQAIISGAKSVSRVIADTSKATPNTEMLQGGGYDFLDRSVVPVNTNGITSVAGGVGKLATTSVPEAIGLAVDAYKAKPVNTPAPTKSIDVPKAAAKVAASIKTAPSDISAVTDVFAQVAAAQAKAKVPTPVTPAVIKTTVKQGAKGTTPIAKFSQSGTWETMFKQVANKANEVISGKGWSNDPKNQDQYENGLIVDGETTQPSSKHEIGIYGMWDKDNNVKSQFLGNYDTFKGYAVKVKVKGGGEYVIPLTYDEIAAHTGANREDILRAGTNDIRSNAVVQRRVYRTALDKLTTQLSNSKGK